jgi:hypothetical protein
VSDHLTCSEFVNHWTDWAEGGVLQDSVELVQQHLADCEGCRRFDEQMRLVVRGPQAALAPRDGDEAPVPVLELFDAWKREEG